MNEYWLRYYLQVYLSLYSIINRHCLNLTLALINSH